MKTMLIALLSVCLLVIAFSGCALNSDPTKVPTTTSVTINTIEGDKDNLPEFATQLENIKIGDDPKCDAVFLSRDLFEKARTDNDFNTWLRNIAFKTILLVYGGDTKEIAEVLELKSPTMITQNSTYAVAVLRATQNAVIGGGILIPDTNNHEITLQDLKVYVILVQDHVK